MTTFLEPARQAAAALGVSGTSRDVFYDSAWAEQRLAYQERKSWYDGDEWQAEISDLRDASGEKPLKWPLQMNPIANACRVHRAVMLGMQANTIVQCPVTTLVKRDELDADMKEQAQTLQAFINNTWYDSGGVSSLFESCLLTQVYGGHVFKIAWEPFNPILPHRIAINSLPTPEFFHCSSYNPCNVWDLWECYIGYEIESDVAMQQFAIDTGGDKALYMEHWTKESYRITVDDKVVAREWNGEVYRSEGENKWGIVPIVYIPHERDGGFLGRSLIDSDSNLIGLAKEINARMADQGEFVQDARPILWGRNVRGSGSMAIRTIERDGVVIAYLLDIGSSRPIPGAGDKLPEIGVVQSDGIPRSVREYTESLEAAFRRQSNIAAVATGDDDVSGGRITGPVTAYRMWPTMQHTMAERAFYHTGMTQVAKIVAKIANEREKEGAYRAIGVQGPGITDEMLQLRFATSWRPMIPIEESQQSDKLNARLQVGGISLNSYLVQQGTQDVEEEEERIWADRERQAEIDAPPEKEEEDELRGEHNAKVPGDQGHSNT